jgi:hypothetical protein
MVRTVAALAALVLCAMGGGTPAAAQTRVGCAPYCDFRHYYGAYDYTYKREGVFCYPVCGPDGTCVPAKTCVTAAPRGVIAIRSFAAPGVVSRGVVGAPANPATSNFYDPTLASPPPIRVRRVRVTPVSPAP